LKKVQCSDLPCSIDGQVEVVTTWLYKRRLSVLSNLHI